MTRCVQTYQSVKSCFLHELFALAQKIFSRCSHFEVDVNSTVNRVKLRLFVDMLRCTLASCHDVAQSLQATTCLVVLVALLVIHMPRGGWNPSRERSRAVDCLWERHTIVGPPQNRSPRNVHGRKLGPPGPTTAENMVPLGPYMAPQTVPPCR